MSITNSARAASGVEQAQPGATFLLESGYTIVQFVLVAPPIALAWRGARG